MDKFRPGEAVCDVMAGVGPFAVPAGKKNVFVWANDLNPASFQSLEDAVRRNKVRVVLRSVWTDVEGTYRHIRSIDSSRYSTKTVEISFAPRRSDCSTRTPRFNYPNICPDSSDQLRPSSQ